MIRLFTPSFADEAGTNAQNLSVKEIVARLDPAEFHVSMFYESAPDPRIAARPSTRLLRWHGRGNTLLAIASLLRQPPHIYFFPREGPLENAFFALKKSLFRNTAVVTYIVSGGLDTAASAPAAMARNVAQAAAVVGNCDYLSQVVAKKFDVRTATIHDGIDRRYFFPANELVNSQPPVVLFAGSLRPYKRGTFFVRMAASRPRAHFRIAGTGEEDSACREFVATHGLPNVEFLGHISQTQLGDEMRRASILFHPSVLEGHPQVLGQAAACGLPVLALNRYHPDFTIDGETGFLAADDAELEQRLDQLLADADLRRQMSRRSVEHARKFDWDAVTALWRQTFLDVLRPGKHS